jgi:hypothetical protein
MDVHFFQRSSNKAYQFDVYRRCSAAFLRRDITCTFHVDEDPRLHTVGDLFVIQSTCCDGDFGNIRMPFIVEEKSDASMPTCISSLGNPHLLRLFRVSVVKREWLNYPVNRVHGYLIDGVHTWPTRRMLGQEEAEKIVPGIHFGMFDQMFPWIERARSRPFSDEWKSRDIDVLFIGQTNYSVPTLRQHRLCFHEVLRSLRGLKVISIPERQLSAEDYFFLSERAKIIVSPWGYGELCFRDFEAILDECVLVKPHTDFIETLGNILRPNETYIGCAPDASDLEEIIHSSLANRAITDARHRRKNRDLVLEWWSSDTIADWWRTELHRGMK